MTISIHLGIVIFYEIEMKMLSLFFHKIRSRQVKTQSAIFLLFLSERLLCERINN